MSDVPEQDATYVLFRLGREEYGLPVSAVVSIIRFKTPTPVPKASESVLGVVNLRGHVLPVVDLGRRFSGSSFAHTPLSRIVVTEGANGVVGVAVDQATAVASFAKAAIKPVPDGLIGRDRARAFVGMVERPTGLAVLLDPEETVARCDYPALALDAADALTGEGADV